MDPNWTTTCFSAAAAGPGSCGTAANPFVIDGSSPHSFTTSGVRNGVYLGIIWPVAAGSPWVVGFELDYGKYDKTSAVTGIVGCTVFCGAFGPAGVTPAFDKTSVRTTSDASGRARVGYLVTPSWLVYGTGGIALQGAEANVTCLGATSPWCTLNRNQTFNGGNAYDALYGGWTAGGGVEWKAWGNLILRGEYRVSQFSTWSLVFNRATIDEVRANINVRSQMALFGISYLFLPF